MPYEVGKTYDLKFVNTIVKDGAIYIVVTDEERDYTVKPYDYQIEYSIFPPTLSCYVKRVGLNGFPFFEQLRAAILEDRYYNTNTVHSFIVDEICRDTNTNSIFYQLSDEFGIQHRYYPKEDEEVKREGASISLLVKGIVSAQPGRNNARLDLEARAPQAELVYSTAQPVYPRNTQRKYFGTENEKQEFKSSIVYPAGQTSPDIDQQLGIICRTIAGFMNANGGTLYIGVSDNGHVCGIDGDYSHLNDGDDDFIYKENDDHYLQKITNTICRDLGKIAGTLVGMRIEETEGKKYCIVTIKKAARPIWFKKDKLFVRIVTTNRHLLGDDITQFVLSRVTKNAFVHQKESESQSPAEYTPSPETESDQVVPAETSAPVPQPSAPLTVAKGKKAWRHITFYDNGEWSFQKDELQGADVVCNAVVPSDAKRNNLILVLAYENGHVEAAALKSVLYGRNGLLPEGKRRGKGLYLGNGKLVSVFCSTKNDMLLLTSEIAGEKYVKALDVDTLGIHEHMGMGNGIVRENGAVLISAVHVPDDVGSRISLVGSGVFIEKNQKYTKGGVKLGLLAPEHRQLITTLSQG